jgi:hypothetical protein
MMAWEVESGEARFAWPELEVFQLWVRMAVEWKFYRQDALLPEAALRVPVLQAQLPEISWRRPEGFAACLRCSSKMKRVVRSPWRLELL